MIEKTHHPVALADKHIVRRIAEMIDALLVEQDRKFKQFADSLFKEIILGHNGGIIIEHLSDSQEMPNLNSDSEETIITLIRCEV